MEEVTRAEGDPAQDLGKGLLGAGLAGSLATLLRRRRRVSDWAAPLALSGAGVAILLERRQSRIDEAEDAIVSELERLDPIARAQVLKAVGQKTLALG